MVEQIEELRTEFNARPFGDCCLLEDREVEVLGTILPQASINSRFVTEGIVSRRSEASGIKPLGSLEAGLPEVVLSHPGTTFGRNVPIPSPREERGAPWPKLIFTGKPRWKVVTPSRPQPETSLPAIPLTPPMYFLPLPKGRLIT